jgi:starch phosphorylase
MGITDEPQIGESLTVNAYVRLGPLAPDNVTVQVVHGQVTENDDLVQTSSDDLVVAEQLGDGRYLFTGPVTIDRSGSFGYSVRVLPKHESLANHAELGLVANASN